MGMDIILFAAGVIFGIIGYLLHRKDVAQEAQIIELKAVIVALKTEHTRITDELWNKHNEDAARLHNLEIELAKQYYPKVEMDTRLHELELTIKEGLSEVTGEVRTLNKELMNFLKTCNVNYHPH
jgi:hypothetical protein